MYDKTKYIYVGLDLHKEQHTAVIVDCFKEKLGEITFQNKPSECNGKRSGHGNRRRILKERCFMHPVRRWHMFWARSKRASDRLLESSKISQGKD